MKYADGKTKSFIKLASVTNKTGISVYITGIKDKHTSQDVWKKKNSKECQRCFIKFKTLKDINIDILFGNSIWFLWTKLSEKI